MTLIEVLRGGRQCDEDGVEIIMCRQACVEAADEIVRLRSALAELTALVRGECGALLDEDRGGSASLSMEIDDLLGPNVELTGAAPHGQQTKPQEIEK